LRQAFLPACGFDISADNFLNVLQRLQPSGLRQTD
jgi:hypothetical protein